MCCPGGGSQVQLQAILSQEEVSWTHQSIDSSAVKAGRMHWDQVGKSLVSLSIVPLCILTFHPASACEISLSSVCECLTLRSKEGGKRVSVWEGLDMLDLEFPTKYCY